MAEDVKYMVIEINSNATFTPPKSPIITTNSSSGVIMYVFEDLKNGDVFTYNYVSTFLAIKFT